MEDSEETEDVRRTLMKKLEDLISKLPTYQAEKFIAVDIFPGLVSWLDFWTARKGMLQNEVYKDWYKRKVLVEGSPEANSLFAALFQNIQIRSSSEVCSC